jgi:hypothetical protein
MDRWESQSDLPKEFNCTLSEPNFIKIRSADLKFKHRNGEMDGRRDNTFRYLRILR